MQDTKLFLNRSFRDLLVDFFSILFQNMMLFSQCFHFKVIFTNKIFFF